jgi:hypothetical protein
MSPWSNNGTDACHLILGGVAFWRTFLVVQVPLWWCTKLKIIIFCCSSLWHDT